MRLRLRHGQRRVVIAPVPLAFAAGVTVTRVGGT
jgi:hypothetical protein